MNNQIDDIPPPPPSEFDPDAIDALASPGLYQEERTGIISKARNLVAGGLSREAVCNWICREVARTAGGRSGFVGIDLAGNVIDPPHVAAARKQIKSEAGRKRQTKRNADIEQWRQRCRQMVATGLSESDILHRARAAIRAYHDKLPIPREFDGLPMIYGRGGKSFPKDKKRLRDQLFDRSAH